MSFIDLLESPFFQQLAPILVLLVVPACTLLFASRSDDFMGFDNFSLFAPWHWLTGTNTAKGSASGRHRHHHRHLSKKHARVPHEAANGSAKPDPDENDGYYPGLVNISGTYCFMNSTLQALASLYYLQPHVDTIHTNAEALDVPTPIIDTLQHLFQKLNTPRSSYHSIRPVDIIDALTNVEGRTNALFYSREHQDAQELFQLLSECLKNEITAVDKEAKRDRGLGGLSRNPETIKEIGKSVFDGLTANRRSCVTCEYTEAVMHFSLDNMQLSLPRFAAMCRLEDCLQEYTRLEILRDCVCRKCSLVATYRHLQHDVLMLEEATKPEMNPSNSKKKRLKEYRRMEARVQSALEQGRIEEDLKDVRMERVVSPATKQAMIARPPPVLALHINRSIYGHYATKNTIRLIFPEVLDITPYMTSGNLSVKPTTSISTPPPKSTTTHSELRRSTTPTQSSSHHHHRNNHDHNHHSRTLYRLSAVVCHYGQHSFGHYICYRRKPRSPGLPKEKRWAPPTLVDPLLLRELEIDGVGDEECVKKDVNNKQYDLNLDLGVDLDGTSTTASTKSNSDSGREESPSTRPRFVWDGEDFSEYGPGTGRGWLRISDDSVRECGIESVLAEGTAAFMLYYERVVVDIPGVYPSRKMSGESACDGREVRGGVEIGIGVRNADGMDGMNVDKAGRDSEETLRPRTKTIVMNGSVNTLVSEVGVGVMTKQERPAIPVSMESSSIFSGKPSSLGLEPRIVRSVEAGRKRSLLPSSPPSPTETTSEAMFVSPSASTSTLSSREQSVVSSTTEVSIEGIPDSASRTLSKTELYSSPSRPEDRYHNRLPNGTHSLPDLSHMHTHPKPNSNATLSFPSPPHDQLESTSPSTPTQSSPPQSLSPSPSSSPSRPKPHTLKRKSKHSHSAGKKPPSVQVPRLS
ncbi:hypothetical protein F5887DRAFT_1282546 [Amanita rubescens]|nr:hypothetical protein F5887DRAFT_1282546 [Amanita rubescens]